MSKAALSNSWKATPGRGGNDEEEKLAAGYIVSTALTDYNQNGGGEAVTAMTTRSSAITPGELVALLSSSGNDAAVNSGL